MAIEVTVLSLAGLLQGLQFAAFSVAANRQVGPKVAMGPRDNLPSGLQGTAGRFQRAMNNHFEGLILFTLAVVAVTLGNESTGFTATCAWIYLLVRIVYIPAYVFGWTPWRSVIWIIGFLATMLMILAALI